MLDKGPYIDLDTLNLTNGDFTLSLWTKWNGPNKLNRSVPFRIGGNEIETETWNGAISHVTVETRARSPEWIMALYSSFSPI